VNQLEFMGCMGVFLAGLIGLGKGWKKTAAPVLAAAMFLFVAFLPWPTFDLLIKENRHLKRWATPRMREIRLGWYGFAGFFSAAVALGVLLMKPPVGKREARWDTPRRNWDTGKPLAKLFKSGKADARTFLGIANGNHKVFLKDEARERHMQVVGPTRCGKSQLLLALAGQDMRRGLPVFLMEAKGDRSDFDQFLKLASMTGREDKVLYFNPQDARSMSFNPIRMVPGQDSTAIANQIARAIGREPTASGEGQDYYRSVDYAKIQNMAEVFCRTGRQFTLKDCFHYFTSEEARTKAFRLCKDQRLVQSAKEEFKRNPDTTALSAAFQPWTTGSLGLLLNSYAPTIRLEQIFDESRLAYFALPIGHLQVLANPLGRMIISGLLSVASWRQQTEPKPGPASVILDEFAEFATPVFASFIATVGSARLWTILSHQDLGQLKKVQGMDADAFASAVFNNTSGCKVCFRAPDPEDAEFWSSTLGTYTTFDTTERVQKGLLGLQRTGEMSLREVEHFRIHPNTLKNLASGSALIFSPGSQDCLARTAAVASVLKDIALPPLRTPLAELEEGLDLESAVPADPNVARAHSSGRAVS